MKKILFFLALLTTAFISVSAQTFTKEIKTGLLQKVNQYEVNDAVDRVKILLDYFDKGKCPNEKIINTSYLGIAYVLSSARDYDYYTCSDPAVYPAMWKGYDGEIKIQGIRSQYELNYPKKEYYSDYVQLYLQDKSVANTSEAKFIIKDRSRNGYTEYFFNKNECIIDNSIYARIYNDNIICVSFSEDMDNIMIYSFDIKKQSQLLKFDSNDSEMSDEISGIPDETKEKIEKYRNEEKDRNSFSEMIESLINHPEVNIYYHDREMFIISSGLFRYDFEIKYNGTDMLILPMKLEGLRNYIVFTGMKYDGKETEGNSTIFEFGIPLEGVTGEAVFKFKENEWILENIFVVE